MDKVMLITGASSGIGNETVKLFQTKGWKVAATMRKPEKAEDLQRIVDVECFRLDVTEPESIRNAIRQSLEKFGRIDDRYSATSSNRPDDHGVLDFSGNLRRCKVWNR